MKDETRKIREREIIEIAFAMLERDGFSGLSMQALAKASRASKETLYKWFSGREGLYEAMVAHNASAIVFHQPGETPPHSLERIGRELLSMLLSERAVLLNRVAAAEAGSDNRLGQFLARSGRDRLMPQITALIDVLPVPAWLATSTSLERAEIWLALLVGDLQVRRVVGTIDALGSGAIATRSARAARFILGS